MIKLCKKNPNFFYLLLEEERKIFVDKSSQRLQQKITHITFLFVAVSLSAITIKEGAHFLSLILITLQFI